MKSSLPFTSVVSYHTDPMTCGVAKFSQQLAHQLGVPFLAADEEDEWGECALLSLKDLELPWSLDYQYLPAQFGVFWHDAGRSQITDRASVVFYADPSLGSPGLWCPSLIDARKRPVRLFSFGMAHKLQVDRYRRVRTLLDESAQPFHLRVSVGLHEGTTLDEATKHFDALKDILGPENVTILGILSDDAVSEELHAADYVLAFFEQGLRANNTTVHAALDARRIVITNHDEQTPTPLRLLTRDVDYDWLQSMHREYSWEHLITAMARICEASHLAHAK